MMDEIYQLARNLWVVWLGLIFLSIVAWAYWPSRRRRNQMKDYASIPFREEEALDPAEKER